MSGEITYQDTARRMRFSERIEAGWGSSKNHPQRAKEREADEEPLEGGLVDFAKEKFSGDQTEQHGGGKEEVEEKSVGSDEAEGGTEGDFDKIDEKEKPGGGAYELVFRQAAGEEVNGHRRASGIRQHGGNARKQTEWPCHSWMPSRDLLEARGAFPGNREQEQCEDDPSDHGSEISRRDSRHDRPAEDDSHHGSREDFDQQVPDREFPEGPDGEEVGKDQHRQDDTGRFAGGHDLRHEQNARNRQRSESRFAQTHASSGENGKEPLLCRQVERHTNLTRRLKTWRNLNFDQQHHPSA